MKPDWERSTWLNGGTRKPRNWVDANHGNRGKDQDQRFRVLVNQCGNAAEKGEKENHKKITLGKRKNAILFWDCSQLQD